MPTTDYTKPQLAAILSALDDRPRNPANREAALRAIGKSAERFGLTADDVLAAAPGQLDARLSPEAWRAELADDTGEEPEPEPAAAAPMADAPTAAEPGTEPTGDAPEPEPTPEPAAGQRTPRAGTKQALLIDLLRRPEGATVDQIAEITGWQHHTIRGAISGALKKKLGLAVSAERVRHTGPNAKGGTTVYRIPG